MPQSLYENIPSKCKTKLKPCGNTQKVLLASNQAVNILGETRVKVLIPQGKHSFVMNVLQETSHPFILGTGYFEPHGLILDFSKNTIGSTKKG